MGGTGSAVSVSVNSAFQPFPVLNFHFGFAILIFVFRVIKRETFLDVFRSTKVAQWAIIYASSASPCNWGFVHVDEIPQDREVHETVCVRERERDRQTDKQTK